jgi:hypothetical protein
MKRPFRFGIRFLQIYFIFGLLLLSGFWFFYSRGLFRRLEEETQTRSRIYARWTSQITVLDTTATELSSSTPLSFSTAKPVASNSPIPVSTESDIIFTEVVSKIDFPIIATDPTGNPTWFRNLGSENLAKERLLSLVSRFDQEHSPIPIMAIIDSNVVNLGYVHYGHSPAVRMLRLFPVFQLAFVFIFLVLGIWGILVYKKGEEEHIWTALAKETAHQLGTPLSSLSGWLEVLKTERKDRVLPEIEQDLNRMVKVLERFSRIGLPPTLKPQPLQAIIKAVVSFMKRRAHKAIEFSIDLQADPLVLVDEVLFSWTLENLLKNALDAIGNNPGRIEVATRREGTRYLEIMVRDSGEGIKLKGEEIFKPGVTTKAHGWGLGLPLAKRIIEEFHRGRLVLDRTAPSGSTFRIILPVYPGGESGAAGGTRSLSENIVEE